MRENGVELIWEMSSTSSEPNWSTLSRVRIVQQEHAADHSLKIGCGDTGQPRKMNHSKPLVNKTGLERQALQTKVGDRGQAIVCEQDHQDGTRPVCESIPKALKLEEQPVYFRNATEATG